MADAERADQARTAPSIPPQCEWRIATDISLPPTEPNLHLTPDERRLFGSLFAQADADKIGVVTGERAVTFFEKTKLPSEVLGEIWQLADTENRGLLTPAGFGIVLRLIGYAQAGRPVSREIALKRENDPPETCQDADTGCYSWRTSTKIRGHQCWPYTTTKHGSAYTSSELRPDPRPSLDA